MHINMNTFNADLCITLKDGLNSYVYTNRSISQYKYFLKALVLFKIQYCE